jgi:hypothetical protein
VELRDGTLWNGASTFAFLEPSPTVVGAQSLRLAGPVVVTRDVARDAVAALERAPRLTVLDVGDELLRAEARAAGWAGPLRGPLHRGGARVGSDELPAAVHALLPDVAVERRGFGRRVASLHATADDGLRLRVTLPDRPDVVPELVARVVDVAFGVHRRFGRMASGVRGITIDDGAGSFDDHSTLGSAQSGTGTFFLDTSLAFADALSAQRVRMGGRRGVSATVPRPWATVDGVVAHEYWHNLDATVVASPATYVEINRALGVELGVDTFEHALRGRDTGAPPEWRAALVRIVTEVSLYATTNWREATAELFKLWWCASPTQPRAPIVERFGALLDEQYPPPR